MENETLLKEILGALNDHSKKVDARFTEVGKRFDEVDHKIDNLIKKFDGLRIDLHETQETTDFTVSKVIQHEKKLRQINTQ